MNESSSSCCGGCGCSKPAARKRRMSLELLILIGLPLAVLVAGALTTAVAMQDGFTPVAASGRAAPVGH